MVVVVCPDSVLSDLFSFFPLLMISHHRCGANSPESSPSLPTADVCPAASWCVGRWQVPGHTGTPPRWESQGLRAGVSSKAPVNQDPGGAGGSGCCFPEPLWPLPRPAAAHPLTESGSGMSLLKVSPKSANDVAPSLWFFGLLLSEVTRRQRSACSLFTPCRNVPRSNPQTSVARLFLALIVLKLSVLGSSR